MNNFFSVVVAVMMICAGSFQVWAGSLGFLDKSPIAYFTAEDTKLFKAAVQDVLHHQADGKIVTWMNEESKHSGKVKSIKSFEQGGLSCRTIKFINHAGGVKGQGKYNLCKQKDGVWKIIS